MQNDKSKLKIIFFGTPDFVIPVLKGLIKNFNVVGVVTAPDKPIERKQLLTPPPVKVIAKENNIPVFQPLSLSSRASRASTAIPEIASPPARNDNNIIEEIKSFNPDLFIVAAYGKILPKELLNIPKYGALNIHPSLLPKYRGASPIQATILNGDEQTGISIMLMDEKMDHGAILTTNLLQLTSNYNYTTLGIELFNLGVKHLPETIKKYISGKIKPQEQNHEKATYTKIIKKEDGEIDWNKSADYIERMTRAYYPWPGAYGQLTANNLQLTIKILKARVSNEKTNLKPGTFFKTKNNKLAVSCGDGSVLIIEELQLAGKNKMTSQEFLRGHKI